MRASPLPGRNRSGKLGRAGIVERVVQHERALRGQLADPAAEERVEVVERAEVIVVVELRVEHDGRARPQPRERPIRFVGLGHHVPAAAHPRIGTELRHRATDQERRLLAAPLEHVRDQRAGARLAVRAGHADAVPGGHDLGQHIRTVAHTQAAAARRRAPTRLRPRRSRRSPPCPREGGRDRDPGAHRCPGHAVRRAPRPSDRTPKPCGRGR